MSALQKFYIPSVVSKNGQQYLTRVTKGKHEYFMCGENNLSVVSGHLIQSFNEEEAEEMKQKLDLSVFKIKMEYSDPFEELKRRLMNDLKDSEQQSLKDGLIVALYELEHLYQPYSGNQHIEGSDLNEIKGAASASSES